MLQSDWLSYRIISVISVKWLDVVNKMQMFSHLPKDNFGRNILQKQINYDQIPDLKKDSHDF